MKKENKTLGELEIDFEILFRKITYAELLMLKNLIDRECYNRGVK